MDFITLYTADGCLNLRADQIRSFEYINALENLVIDDGTEGMIVIHDPGRSNYNRLCLRFKTQTLEGRNEDGKSI